MPSLSKSGLLTLTLIAGLNALNCAGLRPNPRFTESPARSGEPNEPVVSASQQPILELERVEEALSVTDDLQGPRKVLTQEIRALLGVPYRWGGATARGMDCSGFVSTVYRNALGLELPRRTRDIFKRGRYIPKDQLKFGDLVFFEKVENYGVSHVGIYVGQDRFAHASTSQGVIISKLTEEYYRERFVGARTVIEHSDQTN